MNKNRNKVAAMMMVAAITVSSLAMPVEAVVKNVNGLKIQKENRDVGQTEEVRLDKDTFPDPVFRLYIENITGIKENNILPKDVLEKVTEINLHNLPNESRKVERLKGIEYFPCLKKLFCSGHNIVNELDLSKNSILETLYCEDNLIKTIKLPKSLRYINCEGNEIHYLDVSNMGNLESLYCSFNNELEILDVSGDVSLTHLLSKGTNLKEINVSDNINLKNIDLSKNKNIERIDLKANKNLIELDISDTNIKKLNLEENKNLENLSISGTKLRELNIEQSEKLTNLFEYDVNYTELGKLDVNKNFRANDYYTDIMFDIYSEKNIDLNKEFGITEKDIADGKVELKKESLDDGVKIEGTNLKWTKDNLYDIKYIYNCGGAYGKVKLNVNLHLSYDPDPEKPNPDKPVNPNPDQGGSGGGTTTPDNKPDTNPDKPNKPIELQGKIVGKNRYETAAKIADQMGSYNTVILVNSDKSMADGLSAASLSGKKNAPILLVKKNSIPSETMARLEKAENVYIIGGNNVISKKVENQLKGKKITRISGKDRYDTSAKIANLLGDYDTAFIVNGAKGEADAMSVSSVAAKYGAPILLTNGKTSKHLKKANVRYFVIGGKAVVSRALEDRYDADRISGVDRYSTNRKIIDEFYYDSKKVYFAKGDTLVDALAVSALAKEDGVVLVSKKANHKKLEGKKAIQVGGMDFEIDVK